MAGKFNPTQWTNITKQEIHTFNPVVVLAFLKTILGQEEYMGILNTTNPNWYERIDHICDNHITDKEMIKNYRAWVESRSKVGLVKGRTSC